MAEPTTSYEAQYPDELYAGNTQRERDLSNNKLVAAARDHNIQDEEIRALQAYLGLTPAGQPFDPAGPNPGTGSTVIDRIIRVSGSGLGCLEDGIICNYSGPNGIDPSGSYYIDTTAGFGDWTPGVGPTGIPGKPGPAPNGPQPTGVPWPMPGDPDPADKPPTAPGDIAGTPWYSDPPFAPIPGNPLTLRWQWLFAAFLRHGSWAMAMAAYREKFLSAETTHFQPRHYDDAFQPIKDLVDNLNGWTTDREQPSSAGVISIFDVLMPLSMIGKRNQDAVGVDFYVGTISGNNVTFNSGSNTVDGGAPGVGVEDVVTILTNLGDDLFLPASLVDLATSPGSVSILGGGVVTGGAYQIETAGPLPPNAQVVVIVNRGYTNHTVMGDENMQRDEIIVGVGPDFVTAEVPVDGKGNRPLMSVWGRTGAAVPWNFLSFNGGIVSTEAFDFGYVVGTRTIKTDVAAAYGQIRVIYDCSRVT